MRNKLSAKKVLLVIVFFFGIMFFGENALAEENQQSSQLSGPPLDVTINNPEFNKNIHQLSVDVQIANNTFGFVDNLNSYLEIYKGDELQKNGYLFSGLDLVYISTKPIKAMPPKETMKKRISYDIPAEVETGKYFVRYVVKDKEMSSYGITYIPSSVYISGSNDYLGFVNAYVEINGKKSDLTLGLNAGKDDIFSLIIVLDENEKLAKMLDKKSLFLETEIKAVAFGNKTIRTFPKQRVETEDYKGKKVVKLDIRPWSDMKMGSFDVVIRFYDKDGKVVSADTMARWFRSENVARINSLISGTNYYKKGDRPDLSVGVALFGFKNSGELLIDIDMQTDSDTVRFSESKKYDSTTRELSFNFNNSKFDRTAMVKSVETKLINKETNEILDEMKINLSSNKKYVNGKVAIATEKTTQPVFKKKSKIFMLTVLFAFLAVIVTVVIFYSIFFKKNKSKRNVANMVLLLFSFSFLGMTVFFGSVKEINADCNIGPSFCADEDSTGKITSISSWIDNNPLIPGRQFPTGNQGSCSVTKTMTIYSAYSCKNCLNGSPVVLGLEARYSNGTADLNKCSAIGWAVPKHQTSGSYGPFVVNVPLSSGNVNYRSLVKLGAGCACAAKSYFSKWANFSCTYTNPTAVIDIPAITPTFHSQGSNVTFKGHGIVSAGNLDYYMWVDTDGTYSPNGRCDNTVGTVLDQGTTFDVTNSTSFATNALSLGPHRVCFNLRERFPDGSALWAGAAGKSDFVDVNIFKIKDSGLRVADDNNNDGVIQPSEIITLMSEDGTCFSPLRIFKSPNIECMTLVNVGDVNASNIRVNTANGGVKAIMLKP